MSHGTKPTALLIEADTSMRRLITLGLQYRGMQVIPGDVSNIPAIAAGQLPDLLVIDVDGGAQSDWSLLAEIESLPNFSSIPIIALAWEAPVLAGMPHEAGDGDNALNGGCIEDIEDAYERVTFLTKPFDARALYATSEQLLAARSPNAGQLTPEIAATGRATTMSIWPLLTAAGLLLAFIGLMGELTLIIIGLLIVIVSLLWWTLGSKPERAVNAMSPMRVERPYPASVS